MPDPARRKSAAALVAALGGVLLLAHLVHRAGPSKLLDEIASMGWGLVLVIGLAGLSHAVRAWAWRLTLTDRRHRPSFGRMFSLRLVSEAAGQAGGLGQVFGDTWRVGALGAELPLAERISSVALDRTLYALSSTMVTIAGLVSVAFLIPLPGKLGSYAKIFGGVLVAILCLAAVAVRRRWPLITGVAGALGRIGRVGRGLEGKRESIQSVEETLLDFFHRSPAVFRANLALQLIAQAAAVSEVYLILRLMGSHATFPAALAIEGFTKLINVIGVINPGNTGTYEGGNMLLAKLAGMSGPAGLSLGLIRRVRAIFWAGVGATCAVALPRPMAGEHGKSKDAVAPATDGPTAVILTQSIPANAKIAS